MRFFFIFICLAALWGPGCRSTTVMLLPALHGAHRNHPVYTYDTLFAIIDRFQPDVLAVEIRPEDTGQDTAYLKRFYPYEMWQAAWRYRHLNPAGIDDFGPELRGRLLPADVFQDTSNFVGRFAQSGKHISSDALITARKARFGTDSLLELQQQLIMQGGPEQFMDSAFDRLIQTYYNRLDSVYHNTPWSWYHAFNIARDRKITEQITQLVRGHKGRRILVLLGASHRPRAAAALSGLRRLRLGGHLPGPKDQKEH